MANTDSWTSSDWPLTLQESFLVERDFQRSRKWIVDNFNFLAALVALADTDRQPSELYLIARNDAEKDIPIEFFDAISKRAKTCPINIRFVDSFLKPCDTNTDRKRLELLNDKERFPLIRFYGYLGAIMMNSPMMANLVSYGLAIKNAADAALVSHLTRNYKNSALRHLNISVSSEVAVHELKPLYKSFPVIMVHLTFPYLADENVNNVRPAIDALTTGTGIASLNFPKSQLTAAGAWRLGCRLESLKASGVCIEPCGNWKPDQKDKEDITRMFKTTKIVTGWVQWDVNWLYK